MGVQGEYAPILSLREYLSGVSRVVKEDGFHNALENRLLVVPPWQREYVWKPSDNGEVGVLLQDLSDFLNSEDDDYLMGSVLLSNSEKSKNERLLIDGQQRTLTYTILLMAILKHVQNSKNLVHHLGTPVQNEIEDRTLVDMRSCVSASVDMYEQRVSMPHSKADEMLQSIFYWSKVADGEASDVFTAEKDHWTQTQRNLIDVAIWIYEKKLKTQDWLPNSDLLKLTRKMLDSVKFMQVTLSTQQEAIAIFDRINSRGALLDSGDLIKNRIFQSVNDDSEFDDISQYWIGMNDNLAKCSLKRMREPKFILRALALADQDLQEYVDVEGGNPDTKYSASKITYERLTSYWGDRLSPRNQEQEKNKVTAIGFAQQLLSASEFLQAVSIEKTPKQDSLVELYFSRYLNSVQHFPMLLAGKNIENTKVLAHLARQIHNRTAFYLLSEERTQDFESLVPTWTGLIAKAGPKATIDTLNDIYSEYVAVSDEDLDLLVGQMKLWSYKTSDKKKIRAVLSQLTRIVDKAGGKQDKDSPASYFSTTKDDNAESWDIDHIEPKKSADKDSELNRIGNLVLLKANHNRLKRIASPKEKSDVYKGSQLLLTQSLVKIQVHSEREKVEKFAISAGSKVPDGNLSNWDPTSMSARANFYGSLLKHHLSTFS